MKTGQTQRYRGKQSGQRGAELYQQNWWNNFRQRLGVVQFPDQQREKSNREPKADCVFLGVLRGVALQHEKGHDGSR